jgi:hypothetical protein
VDVAHGGKPHVQRDAEPARIAHILIMISSSGSDGPQMRPPTLPQLLPGQEMIDLRQPARHSSDADHSGIWRQPVYIGNREDRLPPGKSVRARPAGLPGLGKRRLPEQTPPAGRRTTEQMKASARCPLSMLG